MNKVHAVVLTALAVGTGMVAMYFATINEWLWVPGFAVAAAMFLRNSITVTIEKK